MKHSAESHPFLMPFFCGIGKGPGDGFWGFNRCVRRVAQRFRVLVEKWGKRESGRVGEWVKSARSIDQTVYRFFANQKGKQ